MPIGTILFFSPISLAATQTAEGTSNPKERALRSFLKNRKTPDGESAESLAALAAKNGWTVSDLRSLETSFRALGGRYNIVYEAPPEGAFSNPVSSTILGKIARVGDPYVAFSINLAAKKDPRYLKGGVFHEAMRQHEQRHLVQLPFFVKWGEQEAKLGSIVTVTGTQVRFDREGAKRFESAIFLFFEREEEKLRLDPSLLELETKSSKPISAGELFKQKTAYIRKTQGKLYRDQQKGADELRKWVLEVAVWAQATPVEQARYNDYLSLYPYSEQGKQVQMMQVAALEAIARGHGVQITSPTYLRQREFVQRTDTPERKGDLKLYNLIVDYFTVIFKISKQTLPR